MGSLWIPCLRFIRWIEQRIKCFVTWFGFSHSSWSWDIHCSDWLFARARYPPWRVFKFSALDWQKTLYHHPGPSPWRAFSDPSTVWSLPRVPVFLLFLNSPRLWKMCVFSAFLLAQKCPFLHLTWDITHHSSTNPCSTIGNSLLRTKTKGCSYFSIFFSFWVGWSQNPLRENLWKGKMLEKHLRYLLNKQPLSQQCPGG